MPLRILVAPDKFKGTLTAHAAAEAIGEGWLLGRPADDVETLPMTDGGDGFGAVMGELLSGRRRTAKTVDAAHRPLRALWWHAGGKSASIIDTAGIVGLALLPRNKYHPFQLDTFGLGTMLRAAAKAGAKKAIVGLGGSATNDGGFGMARALGWQFFNRAGLAITEWWQLHELFEIRPPSRKLPLKITGAVDVQNPLLGAEGCARVFGPQKGLRPQDMALAEKCLTRLAAVLEEQHGIGGAKAPGAGAAGGLGFGLMAFTGAKLESGFDIFSRCANLEKRLARADLVITGEGRLDAQTHMGKGGGLIARRCRKSGIPCLALAGSIADARLFSHARSLTEITTLDSAIRHAFRHLRDLSRQVAERAFDIRGLNVD
jgi:glycerate kinase